MYGYDGNLSAEDWVRLGLSTEALSKHDRVRLVQNGVLDESHIGDLTIEEIVAYVRAGTLDAKHLNHFTEEDLDLGLDLPTPDYTRNAPEGALLIGD